jgi:hypothetical protein
MNDVYYISQDGPNYAHFERAKEAASGYLRDLGEVAKAEPRWDTEGNPTPELIDAFHRMHPAIGEGSCWPVSRGVGS